MFPRQPFNFSSCGFLLLSAILLPLLTLSASAQVSAIKLDKAPGVALVEAKLDGIILPELKLAGVPVLDAINQVRAAAEQADTAPVANDRGVNIFLKLSPGAQSRLKEQKITLDLKVVSVRSALQAVAEQAGLETKIEPYAVFMHAVN